MTKWGRAYTPKKTKDFEADVARMAVNQVGQSPLEGPLEMKITFHIAKPKSVKREYPHVKPDLDNLEKSLIDALNTIVFHDDAQIIRKFSQKVYDTHSAISVEVAELGNLDIFTV